MVGEGTKLGNSITKPRHSGLLIHTFWKIKKVCLVNKVRRLIVGIMGVFSWVAKL